MATADVTTVGTPSPIPIPPDFPVTWERPEDERLLWRAGPYALPRAGDTADGHLHPSVQRRL